jgi:hypothetical protein
MASLRDIRVCAVQALHQFDAGNAEHPELVTALLTVGVAIQVSQPAVSPISESAGCPRYLFDALAL